MDPLTLVVTVRCLSCGLSYPKPAGRGTMKTNPGCPVCGYLGWAAADSAGLTPAFARLRFDAGRPQLRSGSRR